MKQALPAAQAYGSDIVKELTRTAREKGLM